MRIASLPKSPLSLVPYTSAIGGGRSRRNILYLHEAKVDFLPPGLDAILMAADLQGVANGGNHSQLLGEALAIHYYELALQGVLPSPERVGVVLAGDLFSAPEGNVRGATGDVASVYQAFNCRFRWVVGVLGNHDVISASDKRALEARGNTFFLDGESVTLDDIEIGGVGLVIGNSAKAGRRSEDEYIKRLRTVLTHGPEILVLHEGPPGSNDRKGNPAIGKILKGAEIPLIVCGHSHWLHPLYEPKAHQQVLNVDARALLLSR